MAVKVNVKWGKELYKDVEVDTSQPPLVFKAQLFALSGVPPERQKVLIKGGQLKDDEWGKAAPKAGMTLMMMGSAAEAAAGIEPPPNAPKFVEDLPEEEQATLETRAYGSGLKNLGNTCYMNSTLQCLYSAAGLRDAILRYTPGSGAGAAASGSLAAAAAAGPGGESARKLAAATRELFADLQRGGEPFPPFKFLLTLRQRYPQFAQQTNEGFYMQQDAEECWTQVMQTLKQELKEPDGQSSIDKLFGLRLHTKLRCEETGEEFEEDSTVYQLKCNISVEVNYLHQGIQLGLVDDREKNSAKADRMVVFAGSARIASLPPYLTVQMMRFFFKRTPDGGQNAKILRKVAFPMELDVYDFCTPELQAALAGPRDALKAAADAAALEKRTAKQLKTEDGPKPGPGDAAAAAAAAGGDVEMRDAAADTAGSSSSSAGELTGKYELIGVLTHKGRSADSGHYVAWVRQADGATWVLFDDDELIVKTQEDVLALCGGGDWHMGYLLLYRAVRAPAGAAAAAAAAPAAAGDAAAAAPSNGADKPAAA